MGSTPREARRRPHPLDPGCDFRLSEAHGVEQPGIIAKRDAEMRMGVTGVARDEASSKLTLPPTRGTIPLFDARYRWLTIRDLTA